MNWYIKTAHKEFQYDGPQVMGIINVTPDSFYAGSRVAGEEAIARRARQILDEGGTMIDVGAYSTRPDAAEVSPEEEMERLSRALPIIRAEVGKDVLISVDTFRASVAEMAVQELGADVINDVSGGTLDEQMFAVVVRTGAPYIMMHMRGTPQTMQQLTDYPQGVTAEVIEFFDRQLEKIHAEEVRQGVPYPLVGRLILDPGFGFAKTLSQNYELMREMAQIGQKYPDFPLLVGISRKSMIYRLLGNDAQHALNGTTVLNTLSLQLGADILRVHDVREAVETIQIVKAYQRKKRE